MSESREDPYLAKAERSLLGAESEFAAGRYENVANRAYYACFQAAIAALRVAGVESPGDQWPHGFVQAQFVGQLINRRRRYPPRLRSVLGDLVQRRQRADYSPDFITETEAGRCPRHARDFVAAVHE